MFSQSWVAVASLLIALAVAQCPRPVPPPLRVQECCSTVFPPTNPTIVTVAGILGMDISCLTEPFPFRNGPVNPEMVIWGLGNLFRIRFKVQAKGPEPEPNRTLPSLLVREAEVVDVRGARNAGAGSTEEDAKAILEAGGKDRPIAGDQLEESDEGDWEEDDGSE
ncbi:hypothetical protein B0H17DRAFT_1147222 [Mycena rosella]|uniref:Hydrophobin n=1 Tax=Mycena rosella TaxID=1033263 RepID=A0AAD7CM43_MYCRO|nr:hypothetical protein B0H17DRAFT_1147222 [Mycena rosella]